MGKWRPPSCWSTLSCWGATIIEHILDKVPAYCNLESQVSTNLKTKVLHLLYPRDVRIHHGLVHNKMEQFYPPFVAPKLGGVVPSQLISYIYTSHILRILDVHGRRWYYELATQSWYAPEHSNFRCPRRCGNADQCHQLRVLP